MVRCAHTILSVDVLDVDDGSVEERDFLADEASDYHLRGAPLAEFRAQGRLALTF